MFCEWNVIRTVELNSDWDREEDDDFLAWTWPWQSQQQQQCITNDEQVRLRRRPQKWSCLLADLLTGKWDSHDQWSRAAVFVFLSLEYHDDESWVVSTMTGRWLSSEIWFQAQARTRFAIRCVLPKTHLTTRHGHRHSLHRGCLGFQDL